MPSMNKDIKEQWLTALRSGEYKQCRNRLKKIKGNKESFCCLGVLTDLAIKSGGVDIHWNNEAIINKNDDVNKSVLDREIIQWAGATIGDVGEFRNLKGDYIVLASKNDRGASFKKIADIIEKHIVGV